MIKKYFLRANTAEKEANLLCENLKGIDEIITVKTRSRKAGNRLLTRIAHLISEKGLTVEGIMSPYEVGCYEGLIIREKGFGIFDEHLARGVKGDILDLDCFAKSRLMISDEEEALLCQKTKGAYENLYNSYKEAKLIHDEWEKIYIDNMDFDRLNSYTKGVMAQLITSKKGNQEGYRRTGFFGASTPDGTVNYIEALTKDMDKRYFIKGRPGTGKSTFLKRLAAFAEKNGYDTEVYYCSFDKNSLDMVVVKDLSLAVFDSTPPHELFPARNGDGVLDFYTESGLFGVDENLAEELKYVSERYALKIKQGLGYLRLGNSFDSELQFYYSRDIDDEGICALADKIIRQLV